MKKIIFAAAAAVLCIYNFCLNAEAVTFEPDFDINGQSVILMNLDTESVIYEKNGDMEQMPSSLVNIMTAVVVLEECKDPDAVTITADRSLYYEFNDYEYQDDIRYAEIWDGDTFTVTDYLYALMLTSSCEAANILADYFGKGDISIFVDKMNKKAEEIGLEHTHFCNPHGLYDPKQVTTAEDMLTLTLYALDVPGFEKIATTDEYEVKPVSVDTPHDESWTWTHSNIVMRPASDYYLYGVRGIKTGNLTLGGRSVIAIGTSKGISYLLVDLNTPLYDEDGDPMYYHMLDEYNLMRWAFDSFEYKEILDHTEEIAEVKVSDSEGKGYVLVNPSKDLKTLWYNEIDITSVQRNMNIAEYAEAPVKKGQKLGEIELRLSDETIATIDLVAAEDVERSLVKFNISAAKNFLHSKWIGRAILLSVILSLLYFGICVWAFSYARRNPKGGLANKRIVKKLGKFKGR